LADVAPSWSTPHPAELRSATFSHKGRREERASPAALDSLAPLRFTPAMSAPVEIRNSAASNTFQIIAPFVGAAVAGVLAFRAISSEMTRGPVFLLIVFALGCLGWGLFKAASGFDSGVQVTLDAKGFRDKRAGDVLVPWETVRSAGLVHGNHGGPTLVNFELTGPLPEAIKYSNANALGLMLPGGGHTVHMEMSSLDISETEMMAAIRRLAPGVKVGR